MELKGKSAITTGGSRGIKDVEHLLSRVKKIIEDIYGGRLVDIILYGSFARNGATPDSDIDIAVVLKGVVDVMKEIDRISDSLYMLELEYGELISVYPMSLEELEDTVWPLYYHIRTEGVKI